MTETWKLLLLFASGLLRVSCWNLRKEEEKGLLNNVTLLMKAVLLEKLKIYMRRHTHMDGIIYDFSKRKMKTAYVLGSLSWDSWRALYKNSWNELYHRNWTTGRLHSLWVKLHIPCSFKEKAVFWKHPWSSKSAFLWRGQHLWEEGRLFPFDLRLGSMERYFRCRHG